MSPLERELKIPVADLGPVRNRLRAVGAQRLQQGGLEDNLLFDRGHELRDASCLLRLREDRGGRRLTFKGPARFEGDVKVREEVEVEVGGLEEMRSILERLGFAIHRRYQKEREEWRLERVRVALDHTPIGEFVEVEGEGAEEIARRCGLDPTLSESRSYLDLYRDWVRDHPGAPRDMVFPGREGVVETNGGDSRSRGA